MAKNWTIRLQEEDIDKDFLSVKIELTHKPAFNL
jgi:hypothetical protein